MPGDAAEIRRVLQVYDQVAAAPSPRQAVGMLQGITAAVAKSPDTYDLLEEPDEAEAWAAGGGPSFCDNEEFSNLLAARWTEVFSRPDFADAGFDKDELRQLKAELTRWAAALDKSGLEFGDSAALLARVDELVEAAPEAEEDSD